MSVTCRLHQGLQDTLRDRLPLPVTATAQKLMVSHGNGKTFKLIGYVRHFRNPTQWFQSKTGEKQWWVGGEQTIVAFIPSVQNYSSRNSTDPVERQVMRLAAPSSPAFRTMFHDHMVAGVCFFWKRQRWNTLPLENQNYDSSSYPTHTVTDLPDFHWIVALYLPPPHSEHATSQ